MGVWSWIVGLAAGTVFGTYVAQNYEVPNVVDVFGRVREMVSDYQKPAAKSEPSSTGKADKPAAKGDDDD
ncbi:hypothetical protein EMCRGX_G031619 [Ephydatia muelleri]|eukprot:Em0200g2a